MRTTSDGPVSTVQTYTTTIWELQPTALVGEVGSSGKQSMQIYPITNYAELIKLDRNYYKEPFP